MRFLLGSRLLPVLIIGLVLLSVSQAFAQEDNTCTALMNQGLNQISTVCANVDDDTLCYGNKPVSVTLFDPADAAPFDSLGDRIPVNNVDTVQTGIASKKDGTLGIGLMNIRANLPASLSDQHVVLMNLGGINVENRVAPEDALKLGSAVDTTVATTAELHVSPLATSEVLATIPADSPVSSDAISTDGKWVRVVYQEQPGWVDRSALAPDLNAGKLTVVGSNSFTSMQSFYLHAKDLNSYASTPCRSMSSFLLAQGPKDIPVDIRVEDVPIRIGSTVLMRVLPGDGQCGVLQIVTMYGMATLYPDSDHPILVPPGYTLSAAIHCTSDGDPDYTHPLIYSDWSAPTLLTDTDLSDFSVIDSLPDNLLNYTIELPSIIRASGRSVISFVFFADSEATRSAEDACARGELSDEICQNLGLTNNLACGDVTDGGLNGFPVIGVSNCLPDTTVVQAPPWTPIVPGLAVCQDWLVYHTNKTGDWELFRLGDLPGGVQADPNLSRGVGPRVYDVAPARSPDQSWVAFMSNRDGNWEIYVSSVTEDEQYRVTFNTTSIERNPAWSNDGKTIVYESSRNGNWDLYAFDVTTGVERQLTDSTGNDINGYWSPDSTKLIYQNDSAGFWQIYELNLTTMATRVLSDGTGDDHDPKYSNDGQRIAFLSYRDGTNSDVYVMNADGTQPARISDVAGKALNQAWSPDSSLIAYQSNLDGDDDVYVYDFTTSQTRKVSDNTIGDYAPTWMCDSTNLVFTSDITQDSNLFSTDALPITAPPILVQNASQLTSDKRADQYPVNSPLVESASEEGSFPSPVKNK